MSSGETTNTHVLFRLTQGWGWQLFQAYLNVTQVISGQILWCGSTKQTCCYGDTYLSSCWPRHTHLWWDLGQHECFAGLSSLAFIWIDKFRRFLQQNIFAKIICIFYHCHWLSAVCVSDYNLKMIQRISAYILLNMMPLLASYQQNLGEQG